MFTCHDNKQIKPKQPGVREITASRELFTALADNFDSTHDVTSDDYTKSLPRRFWNHKNQFLFQIPCALCQRKRVTNALFDFKTGPAMCEQLPSMIQLQLGNVLQDAGTYDNYFCWPTT